MRLIPRRVEAGTGTQGNEAHSSTMEGSAAELGVGPLIVTYHLEDGLCSWTVANSGDEPVTVRSVALVFGLDGATEPIRMFRNGYQSWSPTGVATLGVDVDPSTVADFEFLQAAHHADQRTAQAGELRSEWVTLLADADAARPPVLIGFDGGHEHDGTLRLRPVEGGGAELWVEAFLGGAVLAPGEERPLHEVLIDDGDADPAGKLDQWATVVGRRGGARVETPFQVGWCSWYQYFHDITEEQLRHNLALADQWPFEVFQLDDGYQSAIGDWLTTNDKFPSSLEQIAASIAAAGRRPGIWLAPFLVAPDSQVATGHPDWIARHIGADGQETGPLRAWWNEPWGGGDDGFMYGLDTTNPQVLSHLESVGAQLVAAGFTYLKLDFTFSPSHDGRYLDPSRTPAQRVRAGFDAIRRGAGDDAFILGCGVPLSNVVGVVDANRIGQDVAPLWSLNPDDEVVPGYLGIEPATQFALGNTMNRAFMHRRLWLNDPDCLMLRATDTDLTPEAAHTWARAVGVSGGMALVSDDLGLLDDASRRLLDEAIELGRSSDDAARQGSGARCLDLMDHRLPTTLRSATHQIVVDSATGASELYEI